MDENFITEYRVDSEDTFIDMSYFGNSVSYSFECFHLSENLINLKLENQSLKKTSVFTSS